MKQISLPEDVYTSLEALATEKGQTVEGVIADLVKEEEWQTYADKALQEYDVWKVTHTPQIFTEEEFFAELTGIPLPEHADADV